MSADAWVPGLQVTALGVKVEVPPPSNEAERDRLEREASSQLSVALVLVDQLIARAVEERSPHDVMRAQTQLRRAIVGFMRAGTPESLEEAARALTELSKLTRAESAVRVRHSTDRQIVDALWRALERCGGPRRVDFDAPAAAVVVSSAQHDLLATLLGNRQRN